MKKLFLMMPALLLVMMMVVSCGGNNPDGVTLTKEQQVVYDQFLNGITAGSTTTDMDAQAVAAAVTASNKALEAFKPAVEIKDTMAGQAVKAKTSKEDLMKRFQVVKKA